MKFHWFAEVTYGHLPPDFPQQLAAAGRGGMPDPPLRFLDSAEVGADYRMFIRLMQQADALGWDGLAVNEHHQTFFAMTPSPNLLAASLASTTQNAAILIIGDSLALYNPPIRVAEEMAYLDCLSEGRVIAGFVFGTPMDSTFAYGMPPIELRERWAEARDLIVRAWAEDEPFAWNGRYTKLRYVNLVPKPIQRPKPPIWVPGTGSLETWDLAIDNDYCYGYLSFFGLDNTRPIVEGWWSQVEKRGGDANPNRFAFTQLICCADTDEEAERLYSDAVKYFYTHNAVLPHFAAPPGYTSVDSLRAFANREARARHEERIKAAKGELSFWEFDEAGFIVAGSPERVRQRLRELCTTLRIGQLITCMHMGNLPEEVAAMNNELFGTQVAPYLRDLWADEPDPWTPETSKRRVAANAPVVDTVNPG